MGKQSPSLCIFIFDTFHLAHKVYYLQDFLDPGRGNAFRALRQLVEGFGGDSLVEIVEAIGFGFAGEETQVGLKIFDEDGERSQPRVQILSIRKILLAVSPTASATAR
jgi:hypothetical protein